jgi:hypothetical protein
MKWLLPSLLLAGIVIVLVASFIEPKRATVAPPPPQPQITLAHTLVQCGKLKARYVDNVFSGNDLILTNCLLPGRTTIIQKDGTIWVEAR